MMTREEFHDAFNSLAIARGMTESVKASMTGELNFTEEQKISKLTKALAAMDKLEEQLKKMKEKI